MMSFGVIGTSVRGGNIDLLSSLTVPEESRTEVLRRLKDACGFDELVGVFTCNRVEFYYVSNAPTVGAANRNRLLDFFFRNQEKVSFEPEDFYYHSAFRALRHLYRVTGSLDSMMVGEAQILGQMKKALSDARESGLAGPRLTNLFNEAFRVARKIRRETPLGEKSVSMVSLVVGSIVGHLSQERRSTVAIVGVGPMSVKLAAALKGRDNIDLLFVNRSIDRAQELAGEYGGRASALADFLANPASVDVVFSATSAPAAIVTPEAVVRIQEARQATDPLLLVDLAIPHDIDPACANIPGVTRQDVSDLRAMADQNRRARFVAVDAAEQIIEGEIGRAHRDYAEAQFRPVFASAVNEGLAYAQAGLERLFETRLPHLTGTERDAIRHYVEKLVRYTNQLPVNALVEQADLGVGECAMIAGYGCMQTRASELVDSADPLANRCSQMENGCAAYGVLSPKLRRS